MISFCPHCCNRAPQTIVHEQEYDGISWGIDDGEEDRYDGQYFVSRCETCKQILLYHSIFDAEPELIFPVISLGKFVPESVSDIYDEAIRIKNIAPNAFAVQIRRALEAVCIDRGSTKPNLAKQLKELADKGEIPTTLSEASDILRIVGNIGAHASKKDIHPLQALAIDEFFKAIIEYVYVSPSKIEKFNKRRDAYNKLEAQA